MQDRKREIGIKTENDRETQREKETDGRTERER